MSNLDAKLRVQTESVLAVIQRRLDLTTLMATHDQREAMVIGSTDYLSRCDLRDVPDRGR